MMNVRCSWFALFMAASLVSMCAAAVCGISPASTYLWGAGMAFSTLALVVHVFKAISKELSAWTVSMGLLFGSLYAMLMASLTGFPLLWLMGLGFAAMSVCIQLGWLIKRFLSPSEVT